MKKNDTSNLQVAPAQIVQPLPTRLENMGGIKTKTKNLLDKWIEKFLNFLWEISDPN